MRIAVTYENEFVFQHFGKTQQFKIYDVQDNQIVDTFILDSNGAGHGALADVLSRNCVDVLICGGIGGGAVHALESANIKLCAGCSGPCDEVVKRFINEEIHLNSESNCNHHHHEHEEGHECHCHEHGHHEGGHNCKCHD